eukprot:4172705-Alexandrium_andersonii.AAC.1
MGADEKLLGPQLGGRSDVLVRRPLRLYPVELSFSRCVLSTLRIDQRLECLPALTSIRHQDRNQIHHN